MLGALLAIVSAVFFGVNNATVRRGVLKSTVLQGMAITVPVGVPLFALIAWPMGGFAALAEWGAGAWLWMMLAGVVHFVIGRYGSYRATQALGATLSTPIQQVSILVALALAFVFLCERVNLVNLVGIALVILGPMVVAGRKVASTKAARAKGFEPDFTAGFWWGLVCAIGYGTSPILISLGLGQGGGFDDSVAGVLVSYVAATVVVIALVVAAGGRGYLTGMDRDSIWWFMVSAVLVALSHLFRYLALAIAPVSVVTPIQRLSVIFRILANGAINSDYEVFDQWVVLSIVLALVGAIALSVDTEMLLRLLGSPTGVTAAGSRPLF